MSRAFDANLLNFLSYAIASGQPLPETAGGGFTMGAWVKTSTASQTAAICGVFDESSASSPRCVLRIEAGDAGARAEPSSGVSATYTASALPLNEWVPCLMSYTTAAGSSDALSIYMASAAQVASGTGELNNAGVANIDTFQVGRWGDSTPSNPLNGLVAHPVIWTKALSGAEITAFFAATSQADIEAIADIDMWGYWPLDTANGLNDVSGNTRHLTENGTVALSTDEPFSAAVTAPALTSPTAVSIGTTTVTPRVTTDTANGTAYYVVTPQAEGEPTNLQVEAGTNATDTAPVASGSQVVGATGAITFAEVTGLTAGTAYRISYAHSGTP